jgi:hypothetical protein
MLTTRLRNQKTLSQAVRLYNRSNTPVKAKMLRIWLPPQAFISGPNSSAVPKIQSHTDHMNSSAKMDKPNFLFDEEKPEGIL